MSGWETYTIWLWNQRTPQPNAPTPRKIRLQVAFGPLFFPQTIFFVGWDWFYILRAGNTPQETQPNQILRTLFTGNHINQDPPRTQKPIYIPIFTHDMRSWLIYTPVNNTVLYTITQNPVGLNYFGYYPLPPANQKRAAVDAATVIFCQKSAFGASWGHSLKQIQSIFSSPKRGLQFYEGHKSGWLTVRNAFSQNRSGGVHRL